VRSPPLASQTSAESLSTTTTHRSIPAILGDIATTTLVVGGRAFSVAVADTPDLRRRGLMEVDDLGDLDGMLFVYAVPTTAQFFMKNTLIPLDIAFFDAEGRLIDVLEMVPCDESPCPLYGPSQPFRWALEAPAGSLRGLRPGDRLEFRAPSTENAETR
jgi:uncharacterized membrane protein (UPF0127 family)